MKLRSRNRVILAESHGSLGCSEALTRYDAENDYQSVIHLTVGLGAGAARQVLDLPASALAWTVGSTSFRTSVPHGLDLHLSMTAHIVLVSSFVAMTNLWLELRSA